MNGDLAHPGSPISFLRQSLQTARCNLAHPNQNDRATFVELFTNKDVRRFLGGTLTTQKATQRAERIIGNAKAGLCWSVQDMAGYGCIGLIELAPHHDGQDIEISYQLLPDYWGKSIAFEAVSAVIRYALLEYKLGRLVAETQEANAASRRLLQRCGMKEHRRVSRFGASQVIYAIEASDFN